MRRSDAELEALLREHFRREVADSAGVSAGRSRASPWVSYLATAAAVLFIMAAPVLMWMGGRSPGALADSIHRRWTEAGVRSQLSVIEDLVAEQLRGFGGEQRVPHTQQRGEQ